MNCQWPYATTKDDHFGDLGSAAPRIMTPLPQLLLQDHSTGVLAGGFSPDTYAGRECRNWKGGGKVWHGTKSERQRSGRIVLATRVPARSTCSRRRDSARIAGSRARRTIRSRGRSRRSKREPKQPSTTHGARGSAPRSLPAREAAQTLSVLERLILAHLVSSVASLTEKRRNARSFHSSVS